jgi:hypothetical protein
MNGIEKRITVLELIETLRGVTPDAPVRLITTSQPALGCSISDVRRPSTEVDQDGVVYIVGAGVDEADL